MSSCPEIDLLIDDREDGSGLGGEDCPGCRAIASLGKVRRLVTASEPQEQCARFEPAIAAMIDGTLRAEDVPGLCEHLARCASCNDIAASLTLFEPALRDIPDPIQELQRQAQQPPQTNTLARTRLPSASQHLLQLFPLVALGLIGLAGLVLLSGYFFGPRSRKTEGQGSAPSALSVSAPAVSAPLPEGSAATGVTPPLLSSPSVSNSTTAPSAAPIPPNTASKPEALPIKGNGYLTVECAPQCDSVSLDNKIVGPSPLVRRVVPVGQHRLVLQRGQVTRAATVQVENNEEAKVTIDMTESNTDAGVPSEPDGYLTVVCSPFCDSVEAGSKNLGPSPVVHVPLRPGRYIVTLKKNGAETKRISVVIVSGQVTSNRVSMSDGPLGYGYLTVVCKPGCDQVIVDNVDRGPAPIVGLAVPDGAHTVILKRGAVTRTVSVRVSDTKTSTVRVSME